MDSERIIARLMALCGIGLGIFILARIPTFQVVSEETLFFSIYARILVVPIIGLVVSFLGFRGEAKISGTIGLVLNAISLVSYLFILKFL
jgi:hypothetical protein